jgi:hypothetical protein
MGKVKTALATMAALACASCEELSSPSAEARVLVEFKFIIDGQPHSALSVFHIHVTGSPPILPNPSYIRTVLGDAAVLDTGSQKYFVLRRGRDSPSDMRYANFANVCPSGATGSPVERLDMFRSLCEFSIEDFPPGSRFKPPLLVSFSDVRDQQTITIVQYDWVAPGEQCEAICLVGVAVSPTDLGWHSTLPAQIPWSDRNSPDLPVGLPGRETTEFEDRFGPIVFSDFFASPLPVAEGLNSSIMGRYVQN